jgi:hypothetical protein
MLAVVVLRSGLIPCVVTRVIAIGTTVIVTCLAGNLSNLTSEARGEADNLLQGDSARSNYAVQEVVQLSCLLVLTVQLILTSNTSCTLTLLDISSLNLITPPTERGTEELRERSLVSEGLPTPVTGGRHNELTVLTAKREELTVGTGASVGPGRTSDKTVTVNDNRHDAISFKVSKQGLSSLL